MKTLVLILFFILFSCCAYSQWENDVLLSSNHGSVCTDGPSQRKIGTNNDYVHITWDDSRHNNWEIYYKRSTDGGLTWDEDVRLTNDRWKSRFSTIAVSGAYVHVFWQDNRDGNDEIYYKRSTDNGSTWAEDIRFTNSNRNSWLPSADVNGSVVSVAWDDDRDGNHEIYYRRSLDNGETWESDVRLTDNLAASYFPSLAVSGSFVHVVWSDYRYNEEIYYKRSTDNGATWGEDTRLTFAEDWSDFPSIAAAGSYIHVVWYDFRNEHKQHVYYKRSTDGGLTWGDDTYLSNDTAQSCYAFVAASGPFVHIAWLDNRIAALPCFDNPFYKRSSDGGSTWSSDIKLTNYTGAEAPSLGISGEKVHLIWTDNRTGNSEIYYKRNPTGNTLGLDNEASQVTDFSIFPNPFSAVVNIETEFPSAGYYEVNIYDLNGNHINTLKSADFHPGRNVIHWNGLDINNKPVSSGEYFFSLKTGKDIIIRKAITIK